MKTKVKYLMMEIHEYKMLEVYLNRMAEKGWMLTSMMGYFLVFEKRANHDTAYYVDIQLPGEAAKRTAYRSMIEEYGYTYVAHNSLLQVFRGNKDITIKIRDENEETLSILKKVGFTQWLLKLIALFGLLFLGCHHPQNAADSFTDTTALLTLKSMGLLCFSWLWMLYPYVRWRLFHKVSSRVWSIQLRTCIIKACLLFLCIALLPYTKFSVLLFGALSIVNVACYLYQLLQEKSEPCLRMLSFIMVCITSILMLWLLLPKTPSFAWKPSLQPIPLIEEQGETSKNRLLTKHEMWHGHCGALAKSVEVHFL